MASLSPNALNSELRGEIEMRYPLDANEIIELADLYGTTEEFVFNFVQEFEKEREEQKSQDLTEYVKDVLHNMNLSIDKPSPTFDEFYIAFEKMYGAEDEHFSKDEVEKKFLELTTDKMQMKLFEIRSVIRSIIKEEVGVPTREDINETRQIARKLILEQFGEKSLYDTLQKAHFALRRFDMMAERDIITPGIVQGWANIHKEIAKELENSSEENMSLLQDLEFIFAELIMEKGIIRKNDREAIPQYVEKIKKALQNKKI